MAGFLVHPGYMFYEGEGFLGFLLFMAVVLHESLILWLVRNVRDRGRNPVPWGIGAFFMSPVAWIAWLWRRKAVEGDPETREEDGGHGEDLPVREWRFTKSSPLHLLIEFLLLAGFSYVLVVVVWQAHEAAFPGGAALHILLGLATAAVGLALALKEDGEKASMYRYTCPACHRRLPRTQGRLTRERLLKEVGDRCPHCGHPFEGTVPR